MYGRLFVLRASPSVQEDETTAFAPACVEQVPTGGFHKQTGKAARKRRISMFGAPTTPDKLPSKVSGWQTHADSGPAAAIDKQRLRSKKPHSWPQFSTWNRAGRSS